MPYSDKQLARHRKAMVGGEEIPVVLETHEKLRASGSIRLLRLSPADRAARANKHLLTFLLIAPLSVAVPPHFLWPLVMVTIAVVGYFVRKSRSEIVLGGEAHCPQCNAFQILDPANAEFPLMHFCSECRTRSLANRA